MITGACCIAASLWFTTEMPKIRAVMKPTISDGAPPEVRAKSPSSKSPNW